MKIIHCSDLHLDSKLETHFSPQLARQRSYEICQTFEKMIEYAKAQQVAAVLLCGDVFDSERISSTTFHFVMELIKQAPEINFLYLRGNHDAAFASSQIELPQNLKLFTDQWRYYRCKDLVIAGVELNQSNAKTIYDTLSLESKNKNIVMLHGQAGTESGVEQINLSLLKGKNIDYLALGHIHSYQVNQLDHRGVYCYSGCPEGRGFDELGDKGFVLLDIDRHGIKSQFIDFAFRKHHKLKIDISNLTKITEILDELRKRTQTISPKDLIQITLYGENKLGVPIDVTFLENILKSSFFYVKINDESKYMLNDTQDPVLFHLKNEFIKSVESDSTLTEAEQNTVIQIGLKALENERFFL